MVTMQNEVLKVSLLTISPHNRAILEFFFAGAGKALFRITSAPEAQAFIIDYDHPGAREEWENLNIKQSTPCIVLSIRDVQLPNTIWVSKPLTSKALLDAAKRIQAILPQSVEAVSKTIPTTTLISNKPNSSVVIETKVETVPEPIIPKVRQALADFPPNVGSASKSSPAPKTPEDNTNPFALRREPPLSDTHTEIPPFKADSLSTLSTPNFTNTTAPQPTTAIMSRSPKPLLVPDTITSMAEPPSDDDPVKRQQRWALLCGTLPDTTPTNIQRDGRIFDSNNYLLGTFIEAVKQAKQTGHALQVFITHQHYILLLPQPYYAFSTLDIHGAEFANLCTTPITPNQIHVHTPTEAELTQLDVYTQQHPNHLYDLDACIWTASLLTSGGRLLQGLDPSHFYQLKHWPNLTRLESIPHVMSLSAMWTQQAATPFDIAKQLGIPQRYAFAFHSATYLLNLLERMQIVPKPNPTTEPKKNRGLFSRLLKRLLGGGNK
jgi:hypothetical protein